MALRALSPFFCDPSARLKEVPCRRILCAARRVLFRPHVLFRAGPMLFCSICRCYSQHRSRGLRESCVGVCTKSQRYYLSRLQSGRHPLTRQRLDDPVPAVDLVPTDIPSASADGSAAPSSA